MNGSSQWKFINLYSSLKPVVKMKLNNSEEEKLSNWRHSIPSGVWHFNKEKILSITKLILPDTKISTRLQVQGKGIQSLNTLWKSNIRIREIEWSWYDISIFALTWISILLSLPLILSLMMLRLVGIFKLMALRNVESITDWYWNEFLSIQLNLILNTLTWSWSYNKDWHDTVTY